MAEDYYTCKLCGGTLAHDETRNTIAHDEPVCESFRASCGHYTPCLVQLGDGFTRRHINDADRTA